jgi:hypothetical protein
VVTAISLIILPLITAIYVYIIHEPLLPYLNYDRGLHVYFSPIPLLGFFATILTPFEIIVFIIIILLFPPYPAPFPVKWYFNKRGYIRAVKEYRLVIQVLYVVVPLLIILTILGVIHGFWVPNQNITATKMTATNVKQTNITATETMELFRQTAQIIHPHIIILNFVQYLLLFIVICAILKIIFAVARKEFWLYYARGCFVFMQNAKSEVEEMKYFVMGLNSYNSYLRKNIKLQIKDLKRVYSKIATDTIEQKNNILAKFELLFLPHDDVEDNPVNLSELDNSLNPLRELSSLMETPETDLLIDEPLMSKVRAWVAAAAVIIPISIQIITLFSKSPLFSKFFGGG